MTELRRQHVLKQLERIGARYTEELGHRPMVSLIRSVLRELGLEQVISAAEVIRHATTLAHAFSVIAILTYGGRAATGLFPDCVAVAEKGRYECSGVMIAADVVLGTNHCLGVTEVFLGDSLYGQQGESLPAEVFASNSAYDAALIRLKKVPSAEPDPDRGTVAAGCKLAAGSTVMAVGFGHDPAAMSGFGTKRWAAMTIDSSNNMEPCPSGCAFFTNGGPSVCFGDSGGPAYILDAQDRLILAGIAQHIVGDVCGEGSAFTRIDSTFAQWIESEANITLTKRCP